MFKLLTKIKRHILSKKYDLVIYKGEYLQKRDGEYNGYTVEFIEDTYFKKINFIKSKPCICVEIYYIWRSRTSPLVDKGIDTICLDELPQKAYKMLDKKTEKTTLDKFENLLLIPLALSLVSLLFTKLFSIFFTNNRGFFMEVKEIIKRLKEILNISSNKELSEKLGMNPNNINVWLSKKTINYSVIVEYAEKNPLDLNYVFLGKKDNSSGNIFDKVLLNNKLSNFPLKAIGALIFDLEENKNIATLEDFLESIDDFYQGVNNIKYKLKNRIFL